MSSNAALQDQIRQLRLEISQIEEEKNTKIQSVEALLEEAVG